jgi:hypothetical protein
VVHSVLLNRRTENAQASGGRERRTTEKRVCASLGRVRTSVQTHGADDQ